VYLTQAIQKNEYCSISGQLFRGR